MIIILTISTFVTFFSLILIKYEIKKRKFNTDHRDLDSYKETLLFSFMSFMAFLISCVAILTVNIKEYNEYYFREKNKVELLILENNIFSGTIIKWWTKDYPKIK